MRNHIIDCFEQAAGEKDPEILAPLLRFVATQTERQLGKIRVKVLLGARVVGVGPASVSLASGEVLATNTVVWCTGVKPADVVATSGLPTIKSGQVPVGPDLRVAGHDRVFVLGDVASCERGGKALPALAQVALQQGGQTAPNLVRLLKGQPTRPFRYFDYGALICVGEHHAVVNLMGLRFSGFVAWCVWRTLYLAKLVGVGNRVRVVLGWTLDLLVERSISQIWTSRREVAVRPNASEAVGGFSAAC